MMTEQQYEQLVADVKKEFPDFKIVYKNESNFMKTIDTLLRIISFGKMKSFMTSFITTIGNVVYVPQGWDSKSPPTKAITLRHERVHMRQSARIGRIAFSLLYLLAPVPAFLAYYRTKFEKEAYEESLVALKEYYGDRFFTQELKEQIISHFTSAEYIWMWPWRRSLERWYDAAVDRIKNAKKS
jgi:hypothetical protein